MGEGRSSFLGSQAQPGLIPSSSSLLILKTHKSDKFGIFISTFFWWLEEALRDLDFLR